MKASVQHGAKRSIKRAQIKNRLWTWKCTAFAPDVKLRRAYSQVSDCQLPPTEMCGHLSWNHSTLQPCSARAFLRIIRPSFIVLSTNWRNLTSVFSVHKNEVNQQQQKQYGVLSVFRNADWPQNFISVQTNYRPACVFSFNLKVELLASRFNSIQYGLIRSLQSPRKQSLIFWQETSYNLWQYFVR